jgi:uncharacterized protein (DUF488 family)
MTLYSIGHSNAEISAFLDLLLRYGVELLVDTRSQPYSRYSPQFNREALKASLGEAEIAYLFMGEQLGGRPQASEFYFESGKVDYERLAATPFYLSGIERLLALAEECRLAFMCSEADFKKCHRYWLITHTVVNRGIEVSHIMHSGELIISSASEFEPAQPSLF